MSAEDPRGIIALLTDFSTADSYVAEMKGVLLSALPGATLVDITHSIPPGDVRSAAHVLGRVRRRFPAGTVHLAVVDPGVGTERAALVVAAGGQFFVGPDNGLFTPVLGEATEVIDLPTPPQAAPTFHGRDLFAPAAAAGIHRLAIPTPFAVGRVNCRCAAPSVMWPRARSSATSVLVGKSRSRCATDPLRGGSESA